MNDVIRASPEVLQALRDKCSIHKQLIVHENVDVHRIFNAEPRITRVTSVTESVTLKHVRYGNKESQLTFNPIKPSIFLGGRT